ncbi:MAG: 3-phosphoglycerate dehydrogenase [Zestosphaera tikiterensis]|uniref:3-phosphoglycerate dehydrogenase n=1 Tax=Zestosphaera tikiterensis TaxID=1973259 RepID=A0A2R7Y7U5_9CREN|nr:MAG: 3-phosphoglycerate dehydrogenase [Zestosphaera tikiterensis]
MKALVAAPLHKDALRMLQEAGFEVVYEEYPPEDKLLKLIEDVDVVFVRSKPLITAAVISRGSKLKAIARAGVGLDNIDVKAAEARGIKVFSAPEAPTVSVAELTIGLMLAVVRKIAYADRKMREGKWVKKEAEGIELRGKILGVVGFGRIGREVARIAKKGFGMKVIYYDIARADPKLEEELEATYVDLETLLKKADVVSIHVPLTPETKHLINESRLKLMKSSAVLINTSRGGVVDTNALVKALNEGWIAGAGLDVFEEEPLPQNHPLTKLDNVVLTPHIGASTEEAQERAGLEVVKKVIEFFGLTKK